MKQGKVISAILALTLAALACNLPAPRAVTLTLSVDAAFTAAAQTVEARLTSSAPLSPTPPILAPTASFATLPPLQTTLPPAPTIAPATPTPLPCNLASFVEDVSIPDGTKLVTGAAFTKTWRLKNVGTCTWTSGYALVFERGDQMGGPAAQALTTGTVAPGQTIDISVNLVAPTAPGTYRGEWKLRDSGGVLFGLSTGPFWVEIKALAPTATPTATFTPSPTGGIYTAPLLSGESGSVRSSGEKLSVTNAGDVESNASSQAFLTFGLSGLPAGVTITEVKVNFSNYDMLGDPFGSLGCLRIYAQDYGALDAGDFTSGTPLGAVARWCTPAELSAEAVAADLKAAIQAKVGSTRAQFRAQFNDTASDNDGIADMVRLGANIKLIIKYSLP
ncbi:MAG: hypothetical protein OHK0031_16850 [Anaerolineales bacterium]